MQEFLSFNKGEFSRLSERLPAIHPNYRIASQVVEQLREYSSVPVRDEIDISGLVDILKENFPQILQGKLFPERLQSPRDNIWLDQLIKLTNYQIFIPIGEYVECSIGELQRSEGLVSVFRRGSFESIEQLGMLHGVLLYEGKVQLIEQRNSRERSSNSYRGREIGNLNVEIAPQDEKAAARDPYYQMRKLKARAGLNARAFEIAYSKNREAEPAFMKLVKEPFAQALRKYPYSDVICDRSSASEEVAYRFASYVGALERIAEMKSGVQREALLIQFFKSAQISSLGIVSDEAHDPGSFAMHVLYKAFAKFAEKSGGCSIDGLAEWCSGFCKDAVLSQWERHELIMGPRKRFWL